MEDKHPEDQLHLRRLGPYEERTEKGKARCGRNTAVVPTLTLTFPSGQANPQKKATRKKLR